MYNIPYNKTYLNLDSLNVNGAWGTLDNPIQSGWQNILPKNTPTSNFEKVVTTPVSQNLIVNKPMVIDRNLLSGISRNSNIAVKPVFPVSNLTLVPNNKVNTPGNPMKVDISALKNAELAPSTLADIKNIQNTLTYSPKEEEKSVFLDNKSIDINKILMYSGIGLAALVLIYIIKK